MKMKDCRNCDHINYNHFQTCHNVNVNTGRNFDGVEIQDYNTAETCEYFEEMEEVSKIDRH